MEIETLIRKEKEELCNLNNNKINQQCDYLNDNRIKLTSKIDLYEEIIENKNVSTKNETDVKNDSDNETIPDEIKNFLISNAQDFNIK